jgi:hypothetical protein
LVPVRNKFSLAYAEVSVEAGLRLTNILQQRIPNWMFCKNPSNRPISPKTIIYSHEEDFILMRVHFRLKRVKLSHIKDFNKLIIYHSIYLTGYLKKKDYFCFPFVPLLLASRARFVCVWCLWVCWSVGACVCGCGVHVVLFVCVSLSVCLPSIHLYVCPFVCNIRYL